MALTKKEVEKIAELARLELGEEEKEKFAEDLSSVLGYVQKLSEVNIEKVEPMTGGTNLESVAREDDETKGVSNPQMREQILSASPNRENDYFKVPSIFE
ncbi:MAG: Asp-tRNA(Asn)/Glu-tRNA(Gln) amidotransferase subunit GatC [Candidatus Azambacteria bacterium]|nr:Asp-tRNA(Asn)/Glu-tRNA(Gln) amidotransferase subunit GatC [Candidatus Azambacteria bacterium]